MNPDIMAMSQPDNTRL